MQGEKEEGRVKGVEWAAYYCPSAATRVRGALRSPLWIVGAPSWAMGTRGRTGGGGVLCKLHC